MAGVIGGGKYLMRIYELVTKPIKPIIILITPKVFKRRFKNKIINIEEKIITPIIAMTAAAKLGFPKVPIIELYGLTQFTKSLPVACNIA